MRKTAVLDKELEKRGHRFVRYADDCNIYVRSQRAGERAALTWAESLTNIAATHAPDPVYDEARRHFSEKELADLSIVIAMINAWNRLCIGARAVHPEDPAKGA